MTQPTTRDGPRSRIDNVLDDARRRISPRPSPADLPGLIDAGALVVDIRPVEQRERDGALPGALVLDRNVLEWRLDPTSAHCCSEASGLTPATPIVIVCDEGYASSLAAAALCDLGLEGATDLDGGYRAWRELSAGDTR